MRVPRTALGSTGMDISRIGFGAWAVGGGGWRYAWGDQDDAESAAALRRAIDVGINWVDTAAVYGLGHSEEVVGRVLGDLPAGDRPYVFTKCGLVWNAAEPAAPPARIMRPDSVRREVTGSLRRLGVEAIDLYQVHWPDTGASLEWDEASGGTAPGVDATPLEEYWQVMAELKAEGKVRAIGLSNHDLELVQRAEKVAPVDAVQPPLSMISRTAAPLLGWAAERGVGVVVYSPMQSGLLTGTFSAQRVASLPPNDWRRTSPDFTVGLDRNLALVERLRPVAERRGVSLVELAVAWALHWPGVSGAIVGARRPDQVDEWASGAGALRWPGVSGAGVGARRPDQVDEWASAAALQLADHDLTEIADAISATGAGSGPTSPERR